MSSLSHNNEEHDRWTMAEKRESQPMTPTARPSSTNTFGVVRRILLASALFGVYLLWNSTSAIVDPVYMPKLTGAAKVLHENPLIDGKKLRLFYTSCNQL